MSIFEAISGGIPVKLGKVLDRLTLFLAQLAGIAGVVAAYMGLIYMKMK